MTQHTTKESGYILPIVGAAAVSLCCLSVCCVFKHYRQWASVTITIVQSCLFSTRPDPFDETTILGLVMRCFGFALVSCHMADSACDIALSANFVMWFRALGSLVWMIR